MDIYTTTIYDIEHSRLLSLYSFQISLKETLPRLACYTVVWLASWNRDLELKIPRLMKETYKTIIN